MRTLFAAIIAFCYGSYLTACYLDRPFVEKKQSEVKEYIVKLLTSSQDIK
jgi:hypothetical protein